MAARSGSESLPQAVTVLWQCCGCKATFPNEKNAKIHVAFHVKAMTGGSGPAAPGPGPGRGPGGGRARGTNSDTRRPELERRRGRDGPGPQHHDPSQSGCGHWPPAEHCGAAATAKMQRIVFGAGPGPGPARARGGGLLVARMVTGSLSGAPARADRDAEPASESESESDLATGRGRRRDSDSDRDRYRDAEGGPGDHESPEGGDHGGHYSNDEDSQEPGKLYK